MPAWKFRRIVRQAIDSLPEKYAEAIENVGIVVEDEPEDEDIESVGLDPERDTLFGLYQGVALPDRGMEYSFLPDRITVYRRPILDACADREQVADEVRKTLLHELGHYFGLDEEEIPE